MDTTIAIDEPLDTQSSPVAPLECPTWGWAKQWVLFNEHAELRAESTFQWTNSQRTLQPLHSTLSWPSDNWFTIEMEKLTLLLYFRYCPWLISFTTPCAECTVNDNVHCRMNCRTGSEGKIKTWQWKCVSQVNLQIGPLFIMCLIWDLHWSCTCMDEKEP